MSLLNKVLGDLAAREPGKAELLAGVTVDPATGRRLTSPWPRRLAFLSVAVFAAGAAWFVWRGPTLPFLPAQSRAPEPAAQGAAPAPAAAAESARDQNVEPVGRYRMDTRLDLAAMAPIATDLPRPKPTQLRASQALDSAADDGQEEPAAPARGGAAPAVPAADGEALDYYREGTELLKAGKTGAAEDRFIAALARKPDLHAAREQILALRLRQKRFVDARRSLDIGLRVAPHHVPYREFAARLEAAESGGPGLAAGPIAEPEAPAATGPRAAVADPAAAAESAPPRAPERVASIAPVVRPVPRAADPEQAERLYVRANAAARAGQWPSAESHYREALARDPEHLRAREALAQLLLNQGRHDDVDGVLAAGRAAHPDDLSLRRLAARNELERGRPDRAVALLESSPPTVAADPPYHALLAAAYQRGGRHADALGTYETLLRLHPNEGAWWVGYGISLEGVGEPQRALDAYERARRAGRLDVRLQSFAEQRVAELRPRP